MVKGLSIFQEWFSRFEEQYVLIGGTAAAITMAEAGLPFRGTKDLDIILHVEALTPEFGKLFWEFVKAGGYLQKEGDSQKRPCFYRFQKPQDEEFPYMLELFSRIPDGLDFVPSGHLTPIPMDEQISSLSAILLDRDYYQFVMDGRKNRQGMPTWVAEDRLIPLKAVAWIEMTKRVRQGAMIDSKKINKHLTDIVKLSSLLQPNQIIELSEKLRSDLQIFVQAVLAMNNSVQSESMRRIATAYSIEL